MCRIKNQTNSKPEFADIGKHLSHSSFTVILTCEQMSRMKMWLSFVFVAKKLKQKPGEELSGTATSGCYTEDRASEPFSYDK